MDHDAGHPGSAIAWAETGARAREEKLEKRIAKAEARLAVLEGGTITDEMRALLHEGEGEDEPARGPLTVASDVFKKAYARRLGSREGEE